MPEFENKDYIIDRIKLKKQLNRWRIIAIIIVLIAVFGVVFQQKKDFFEYIGRININGMIFQDQERLNKIDSIAQDKKVKALIIHVDSPGGSFVGAESLYHLLKKISKIKPVVVVMGDVAASGGYMVAMAGEYVIAHLGTLTGSIGILSINYEITGLAEKLGINIELFKSSKYKATPNPFEKITPEIQKEVEDRVMKTKELFLKMVLNTRKISKDNIKLIGSGKLFTSHEALNLGLIDAIGNEDVAKQWLVTNKKLDSKLKIKQLDISSYQINKLVAFASLINNFLTTNHISLSG